MEKIPPTLKADLDNLITEIQYQFERKEKNEEILQKEIERLHHNNSQLQYKTNLLIDALKKVSKANMIVEANKIAQEILDYENK